MSDVKAGTFRIGLLGASAIAPKSMIDPVRRTPGVAVTVVAARDPSRADVYARQHGIPRVEASYAAVVDSDVDAVYIPLHSAAHCEWATRAAESGKHVLVEKPFAESTAEAARMIEAGRKAGVVMAEAFHYWYHPLMQRVLDIVRSGELGAVRHVEANFLCPAFPREGPLAKYVNPTHVDPALGGGALKHFGCYPLHLVRSVAGEPRSIRAQGARGPWGSDASINAELQCDSSITGTVTAAMAGPPRALAMDGFITFEKGTLGIRNYILPHIKTAIVPIPPETGWPSATPANGGRLTVRDADGKERSEDLTGETTWWYQLQAFVAAARGGAPMHTSGNDTLRQMQAVDAILRAAGMAGTERL